MPFGPVDPNLDLVALEERTLARWRARDVVEETKRLRKGAEPWIFYEGPPTANGRPGLHHVWARVFKDLYPRFQTMRGHDVPRKGGWDCHGLPVEIEVEKELGLNTKHEIEAFGVAEFNQRCRDSVSRYVEDWAALTERSGVWIDTKDAYWTLSQRLHRVGLVARPPDVGQGPALRGPPRHARTARAAAPPCRRHEVGARATATSSTRRSTCASPSPTGGRRRRRPAGVDDDAVDADLQRRRRRRARHHLRAASATQPGARPGDGRGRRERAARRRRDRRRGSPAPTSSAGATSGRSPTCRSTTPASASSRPTS